MIDVSGIARWISSAVARAPESGQPRRVRLGPADVRRYLRSGHLSTGDGSRPELDGVDAVELDRTLASLPLLVAEERLTRRHPGFVRYFEALPRIVFLYSRGESSESIASQMNFIATGFGVDSVLDVLAQTVSRRLARA